MKTYRSLAAFAALSLAGLALAQPVSTPGKSALYVGNGAGTAKQVFTPPDAQAKCRTSAASAPGSWMCKEALVTACAAAKASAVESVLCAAPLDGTWKKTTTYKVDAKTCAQVPTVTPASAPAGACTTPVVVTWTKVADERAAFTLATAKVVRFGYQGWEDVGNAFISKTLAAGNHTCVLAEFEVAGVTLADPKPGNAKQCQVSSSAPPTVPPVVTPPVVTPPVDTIPTPPVKPVDPPASAASGFTIGTVQVNLSLIPTTAKIAANKSIQNPPGGWDKDMVVDTSELPSESDIGAARTGCQLVGFRFDDPIVFPGQPGKSHLHTFFGNTGIDAYSTAASLSASGNSTCRGGTINRTSYWVPSMIDTRTGAPLTPMFESNFYYKTGYALPIGSITDVPVGLRMIAGDASGNPSKPSGAAIYACVWNGGNSNWFSSIPTDCPGGDGSWLIMGIDFPQCWDGVNLDSPDHKSHMTNPVNVKANNTGNCPASHPKALPQIAYQILYPVRVTGETRYWRLSSDNYDLTKPAGYSGHGDYFMAWKPEFMTMMVKNCDNAKKDCHSHLLGQGKQMVIP